MLEPVQGRRQNCAENGIGRKGTTFSSHGFPCLAHWPLQIRQASSGRVLHKPLLLWHHLSREGLGASAELHHSSFTASNPGC